LATVELDEVVLSFRPGEPLVRGSGIESLCTRSWDIMPEHSGHGSYGDLAESGRLGLHSEGIPVTGIDRPLFGDGSGPQAGFVLRGRIESLDMSWCQHLRYVFNVDGTQSMRWELFSLLEQRVVYTSTNTSEIDLSDNEDPAVLAVRGINLAVEQSARVLAREPGFREALSKEPEPTATTGNVAATLVISRLPQFTGTLEANSEAVQDATVLLASQGHGSGFFISRDGYILTNAHVVGGLDRIRVQLPGGGAVVGEVVRRNSVRDVALVKVPIDNTPALPLRLSLPAVGADVYAVGAPLEQYLTGTVTKGIVSSIRTDSDGTRYIQADVDIQAGNSGGPLTDSAGNAVGVAVLGIQTAGGGSIGLNFFIPIEDALAALDVVLQ
jgi:S1-C subfamily serine protease